MGKVITQASMSLDGYIADLSDNVGPLFEWSTTGDVEVTGSDPNMVFRVSAPSANASSSDLLGNGEMLVMRTIERPADPLGELVGPQKPVELHDPPFPVYPLGLDGVQPRTLLRKKATHDPHPTAAVFDLPVVFSEPSPDLLGDVPARVVPDEHQHFLARRLELFGAPRKEPHRYTAHGPAVDEPQPHLAADLGQVEPVAGDRFGIGVVLSDRLLDHTMGLSPLGEAAEGRQGHPAPPALVLKAYGPLRVPVGHLHQSVAPPFFFRRGGRGR